MLNKTKKVFSSLILPFTIAFTLSSCSSQNLNWSDNTTQFGLDGYIPRFLSEVKFFSESENREPTVMKDCYIVESPVSPICYGTGENSRFEMRHYRVNQVLGISYSLVYYFDGTEKKLIDTSGDNVFSDFALCDGKRLCYLVSDGTLRVLESDGGRTDYENAFDSEKINLRYHLEEIKFYAEKNCVTIEQNGYYGSQNEIVINGESPVLRSSVEISGPFKTPAGTNENLPWSAETCQTFDIEGIKDIPQYIELYKKTAEAYILFPGYSEPYYKEESIIAEGGYIISDDVLCYSTGENEGYVVKSYRYECDINPLFFEIYRFENNKLKLLDFSGDNTFNNKFLCNGEQLCYIFDKDFLRVLDKDGSRFDLPLNLTLKKLFT